MRSFLKKFTSLGLTLAVLAAVFSPAAVKAAELYQDACTGYASSTICQENRKEQSASNNSIFGTNGILTKVTQIFAVVVGVASVLFIMIAGLQYILSTGDSTKINESKNTILYALVGLGVALLAQSIIIFVLRRL
ncbi:MAG: hypothetical protein JWL85_1005 [Candidatus Saccharibacteria bacterium]|nr:hypothetical protein [Candidatus Saccharibacteria bacterium]